MNQKIGTGYVSTGKVSLILSAQDYQEKAFSLSEIATCHTKQILRAPKKLEMMTLRSTSYFPCFDVRTDSSDPVRYIGFDEVIFFQWMMMHMTYDLNRTTISLFRFLSRRSHLWDEKII
jgi:hypothetical protein